MEEDVKHSTPESSRVHMSEERRKLIPRMIISDESSDPGNAETKQKSDDTVADSKSSSLPNSPEQRKLRKYSEPVSPIVDKKDALNEGEKARKSPRLRPKLPGFFRDEKSQVNQSHPQSGRSEARRERVNERHALQKSLVSTEVEIAQISAERKNLELQQDRLFKSTVKLKNELQEAKQRTSALEDELENFQAQKDILQQRIDSALASNFNPESQGHNFSLLLRILFFTLATLVIIS